MGTTISKGIKSFLSKKKTLKTDDNITNSITENNKKTIEVLSSSSITNNTSTTDIKQATKKSNIQWDLKFYKEKAEQFTVPDQDIRADPSRLRWFFYSNFLLSVMKHGDNLEFLPQKMDQTYIKHYLGPNYVKDQFNAAQENGFITQNNAKSFLPVSKDVSHTKYVQHNS